MPIRELRHRVDDRPVDPCAHVRDGELVRLASVGRGGPTDLEQVHLAVTLDDVIEETRVDASRAGYFAAMYRKVTVAVRDAVVAGRFADGDRMARLDRVFAERYLDAYDQCVTAGTHREDVTADLEAAQRAGISGTPAFIINGVLLQGAQPVEAFERLIERELRALAAAP